MSEIIQVVFEAVDAISGVATRTAITIAQIGQDAEKASQSVKNLSATLGASFVSGLQRGTATTEDFRNQLIETVNKLGLSAEQIEEVAQASSLFTEQELAAARASEQTDQKIEELSSALKDGKITTEQFGAEFGKLAQASQGAAQKMKGLSEVFKTVKMVYSEFTAALAVVQPIYQAVKQVIDETVEYADQVRELSEISGMSAEESSRFIQVLDDFKLTTSDALTATRALSSNGLVPSLQTIADLSEKYLQLNTIEEKNNFIQKNLGQSGVEWVELLSQGKDAILARSQAVSGGLILDEEAIQKARDYQFKLDDLNDSLEALKTSFGQQAIEILIKVVQTAEEGANAWGNLPTQKASAVQQMEQMAVRSASYEDYQRMQKAVLDKMSFWDSVVAFFGSGEGDLPSMYSTYSSIATGFTEADWEQARRYYYWQQRIIEENGGLKTVTNTTQGNTQAQQQFNDGTRAGTAAMEAYDAALVQYADDTNAEIKATTAAWKKYNEVLGDTEKAWKAVVAAGVGGNLAKTFEDAQPTIEQYNTNIEYYQNLLKQGPGIIDVYANKVDEAAEKFGVGSEQYEAAKKQLENVTTDYQNAGGAIDYYKGKLQEQNDAIDKTIAKTIYQQSIGILSADDQLELARSLGQLSEQDYAVAASVETLTEQYDQNGDGAIDSKAKAEEYRQKIQDVNDAVQWAIDHNQPITQEFIFKWVEGEQDKRNIEETAKRQFQQNAQQLGSAYFRPTIAPTIDETAQTEAKTELQQLTDTVQAIGDPQTIKIDTADAIEAAKGLGIQIDTAVARRTLYVDIVVNGNIPALGGNSSEQPPSIPGGPLPGHWELVNGIWTWITGYATGTEYASGLFMAGEGGGGAEYIYAPGGATVFNPKQTRAMQSEMERMRPTEQHNYLYGPATLVITNEESVESLLSVR